jgi:hypothetical protein
LAVRIADRWNPRTLDRPIGQRKNPRPTVPGVFLFISRSGSFAPQWYVPRNGHACWGSLVTAAALGFMATSATSATPAAEQSAATIAAVAVAAIPMAAIAAAAMATVTVATASRFHAAARSLLDHAARRLVAAARGLHRRLGGAARGRVAAATVAAEQATAAVAAVAVAAVAPAAVVAPAGGLAATAAAVTAEIEQDKRKRLGCNTHQTGS